MERLVCQQLCVPPLCPSGFSEVQEGKDLLSSLFSPPCPTRITCWRMFPRVLSHLALALASRFCRTLSQFIVLLAVQKYFLTAILSSS